jgi:hypothetical protein
MLVVVFSVAGCIASAPPSFDMSVSFSASLASPTIGVIGGKTSSLSLIYILYIEKIFFGYLINWYLNQSKNQILLLTCYLFVLYLSNVARGAIYHN